MIGTTSSFTCLIIISTRAGLLGGGYIWLDVDVDVGDDNDDEAEQLGGSWWARERGSHGMYVGGNGNAGARRRRTPLPRASCEFCVERRGEGCALSMAPAWRLKVIGYWRNRHVGVHCAVPRMMAGGFRYERVVT